MIPLTFLALSLTITAGIPPPTIPSIDERRRASPSISTPTENQIVAIRDSLRHRATGGRPLPTPDQLRSQVIAQTGTDTPAPPPAPTPAAPAPTSGMANAPAGPAPADSPPPGGQLPPGGPDASAEPTEPGPPPGGGAPESSSDDDWGDVEEDHNPPPALPRSQMSAGADEQKHADLSALEGRFDLSKLRD